jgi:small-conductance mechanosensitive channel
MNKNNSSYLKYRKLNRLIIAFSISSITLGLLFILNYLNYIILPFLISEIIRILLVSVITLSFANILLRFTVRRVFRIFHKDFALEQRILLTKTYSALTYMLAVIIIINQLGISGENIALIIGFFSTGLAFALRGIVISLIGWFIILVKKPLKIGDYISFADGEGIVKNIASLFVSLEDPLSGRMIEIPNSTFLEKSFVNHGREKIFTSWGIKITKIPEDLRKFTDSVEASLNKSFPDGKFSVSLGIDSGNLHLYVSYYYIPKERAQIRTHLLGKLHSEFKENFQEIKKEK